MRHSASVFLCALLASPAWAGSSGILSTLDRRNVHKGIIRNVELPSPGGTNPSYPANVAAFTSADSKDSAPSDTWYGLDDDEGDEEDSVGYLYNSDEELEDIDTEQDEVAGSQAQRFIRRASNVKKLKSKVNAKTKTKPKTKSKSKRKSGLLGYVDKVCGPSGATKATSKGAGPNGKQAWLNHGISKSNPGGKWVDIIDMKPKLV